MRDHDRMCLGCMGDLPEGADVCPNCGWGKESQNEAHALRAGSVLAGKYLVGRELGQGSFGITYLAWDLPGNRRVAVKEYYPLSLAVRHQDRYTVSPVTDIEVFARGRNKFLNGAKNLAQFAGLPGIVSARDFFEENGTAYLVMEYLEGRTLREELNSRSQPMTVEEALNILTPVAAALEAVHASGLIHRDISPENILLTPGGAKLLDFGTGRAPQGERNHVNVNEGYAPAEQYGNHGELGPWTDVYALAATVYRCVTGREPESFYERVPEDRLTPPGSLNPSVTPEQERALLKGMAVNYKKRCQTVRELMEALKNPPPPAPEPVPRGKAGPILSIIFFALATVGGTAAILLYGRCRNWRRHFAFILLELAAMLLTVPTVFSSIQALRGRVWEEKWRLVRRLCAILCCVVPEAILLYQVTRSLGSELLRNALLCAVGFAVCAMLTDMFAYPLPVETDVPGPPAAKWRQILGILLCLASTATVGYKGFGFLNLKALLYNHLIFDSKSFGLVGVYLIGLQAFILSSAALLRSAVKGLCGTYRPPRGIFRALRLAVHILSVLPIYMLFPPPIPVWRVLSFILALAEVVLADLLVCGAWWKKKNEASRI